MLHSDKLAQSISDANSGAGKAYLHLSHVQAAQLEKALTDDAAALAQVSLASFIEGICGANNHCYSWSKVKFYYSSFYSIRAILMLNNYSIFYVGRTPHTLKSVPGAIPIKRSGNSHTVAFALFRSSFKNDVSLSQEIASMCPLEWLEKQRTEISYRKAPFDDPIAPESFLQSSPRLRLHLQQYLKDKSFLYSFDKDHAIISYPILLLNRLGELIRSQNPQFLLDLDSHYRIMLTRNNCFVPEFQGAFDWINFK